MLSKVIIKNYALIDRLELEFLPGFYIITGETGAGKSIMLGALGLLLGARAETRVIADKSAKSVVEAKFSNVPESLRPVFDEFQLDWDPDETILRREISASGRSRAFVNDSPVNLQQLQAIASRLIDIHSQHGNLSLMNPAAQLETIDAFCGNAPLLETHRRLFAEYREMVREIRRRREEIENVRKNQAIIAFQLEQLDKLDPHPGELERIEREFDILSDADEIRENLSLALNLLQSADDSVLPSLQEAAAALDHVDFSLFESQDDPALSIPTRIREAAVEIKDIAETIAHYADGVASDPVRLAKISQRMQKLYEAEKYFKISTADGLVELRKSLRSQLAAVTDADSGIAELEQEARRKARELKASAALLTDTRSKGGAELSEILCHTAAALGLPNLRLEVAVTAGRIGPDGQDHPEFLCSLNKNQPLMPMAKIASGGEMARLMLSLKAVMSSRMSMPTVIFDEVDTGVSGEIADKMGRMMEGMSVDMQVVAITHLPQVAARGDHHLKVFKTDVESRTVSSVTLLSEKERVEEIARMMSGERLTDEAVEAARALLGK